MQGGFFRRWEESHTLLRSTDGREEFDSALLGARGLNLHVIGLRGLTALASLLLHFLIEWEH